MRASHPASSKQVRILSLELSTSNHLSFLLRACLQAMGLSFKGLYSTEDIVKWGPFFISHTANMRNLFVIFEEI